ncbi:MAG: acyl-ACP--UDP-N-acetylglucosamine O-acyltransferase, partial [Pseudomonadota bacterium]
IGPYCVIGADDYGDIDIGDNVVLKSHVVIDVPCEIGAGTQIFSFAAIAINQDKKATGKVGKVKIGCNNTIREHATINSGTPGGGNVTSIGDNCLIMTAAHVAHDCVIGNNVILVNNATLGGHVVVNDFAIIGGLAAVHQFVKIGKHAIIGGMSGVERDVIPYGTVKGERASLEGLNIIGLKRRNFTKGQINNLRQVYKILFSQHESSFDERLSQVKQNYASDHEIVELVDFICNNVSRELCMPKDTAVSV